jgi:hypothetical protein
MNYAHKQKINLYQKSQAFAPELSALRIAQIWVAIGVVFILFAFAHKLNLKSQLNEIENLKAEQAKESEQLIEVAQLKKSKSTLVSKSELALLKEKISDVDGVISQLRKLDADERYPFSFYIESIVMRHVKGTYLAYINLQDEGRKMSFSGVALEPQLVPIMVQSWQKSPSLISTQVKKVRLDNLKQDKDYVKFNLQAE